MTDSPLDLDAIQARPKRHLGLPDDEKQWPAPATAVEVARQAAVRQRRRQGLPDVVTDPLVIAKVAALLRPALEGSTSARDAAKKAAG